MGFLLLILCPENGLNGAVKVFGSGRLGLLFLARVVVVVQRWSGSFSRLWVLKLTRGSSVPSEGEKTS